MKILLVMHECNSPYNVFPYGIGYIAAVLRKAGNEVIIYDQATGHFSNKHLYEFIKGNPSFDFIGVGFQSAYFPVVKEACKAIKEACGSIPLVLGGSAPSASPEYFMKKFNADFVLTGESDISVLDYVRALRKELPFSSVSGLFWSEGGVIKKSERKPPAKNLDSLPFPAWDLFDMKSYTFPSRHLAVNGIIKSMGILTSRGCPYSCKFCYRIEKGHRMRSIENCLEEIRALIQNYGVNFISFHDDLFMSGKKRVLEFCEAIGRSGLKFNWLCNGRFNIADREQLKAMKEVGCVEISYGLESGDQKILDEMDKRISLENILSVARMTKEEGLLVTVPSMFGLPGETEESLKKTVDMIIKTTSWHDKRTIRPMQPYPGSAYWSECIEKGFLKDEEDFYSKFCSSEKWTVNLTDVPDEEFDKVLFKANKRLLKEHYKHALASDLNMFEKVYFARDLGTFIPLR